jgi:hypothetical protein
METKDREQVKSRFARLSIAEQAERFRSQGMEVHEEPGPDGMPSSTYVISKYGDKFFLCDGPARDVLRVKKVVRPKDDMGYSDDEDYDNEDEDYDNEDDNEDEFIEYVSSITFATKKEKEEAIMETYSDDNEDDDNDENDQDEDDNVDDNSEMASSITFARTDKQGL